MLICIFYKKEENKTNLKLLSIPFLVGFLILVSNPLEILFKTNSMDNFIDKHYDFMFMY